MEGFKKLTVLFAVVFLARVFVRDAESCSCFPRTLQVQFCFSDFVGVVTIKEKIGFKDDDDYEESAYRAQVKHVIKVPKDTNVRKFYESRSSNYMMLYSPATGGMCGVMGLQVGETYLIGGDVSGSRIELHYCNLNMLWSKIGEEEQKYITSNRPLDCNF